MNSNDRCGIFSSNMYIKNINYIQSLCIYNYNNKVHLPNNEDICEGSWARKLPSHTAPRIPIHITRQGSRTEWQVSINSTQSAPKTSACAGNAGISACSMPKYKDPETWLCSWEPNRTDNTVYLLETCSTYCDVGEKTYRHLANATEKRAANGPFSRNSYGFWFLHIALAFIILYYTLFITIGGQLWWAWAFSGSLPLMDVIWYWYLLFVWQNKILSCLWFSWDYVQLQGSVTAKRYDCVKNLFRQGTSVACPHWTEWIRYGKTCPLGFLGRGQRAPSPPARGSGGAL